MLAITRERSVFSDNRPTLETIALEAESGHLTTEERDSLVELNREGGMPGTCHYMACGRSRPLHYEDDVAVAVMHTYLNAPKKVLVLAPGGVAATRIHEAFCGRRFSADRVHLNESFFGMRGMYRRQQGGDEQEENALLQHALVPLNNNGKTKCTDPGNARIHPWELESPSAPLWVVVNPPWTPKMLMLSSGKPTTMAIDTVSCYRPAMWDLVVVYGAEAYDKRQIKWFDEFFPTPNKLFVHLPV